MSCLLIRPPAAGTFDSGEVDAVLFGHTANQRGTVNSLAGRTRRSGKQVRPQSALPELEPRVSAVLEGAAAGALEGTGAGPAGFAGASAGVAAAELAASITPTMV